MFRPEKFFVKGPLPFPVKGKFFDTRFGLIHVQTRKKFLLRDPPPQVKGKIFDTDLAWCMFRRGKKFLSRGLPLPSKGKNFWHQIWLDTCSEWEKKILSRDPPSPVKGKFFDTRFGLIHVQTGKKIFVKGPPLCNSKKLLRLCSRRYASCAHAGGLSFLKFFSNKNYQRLLSVTSIMNKRMVCFHYCKIVTFENMYSV